MANSKPPWIPSHVIRLDGPRDFIRWAGRWGITDQELLDAVAAVGPLAADVATYLGLPVEGQDLRKGPGGRGDRTD